MKTKVVKYAGNWTVLISQGAQSFHLEIGDGRPRKDAIWYKKMFDKAIENFKNEIVNEITHNHPETT